MDGEKLNQALEDIRYGRRIDKNDVADELAGILKVTRRTIYKWIERGTIKEKYHSDINDFITDNEKWIGHESKYSDYDTDTRMLIRMLDESGYAVIMLDKREHIIHATDEYLRVFEFTESIDDRPFRDVFPFLDEQQIGDLESASAGVTKSITEPYEYKGVWFLFENHNWYRGDGTRGGFVSTVTTGTSRESVPDVPKMPFINDRQLYVEQDKLMHGGQNDLQESEVKGAGSVGQLFERFGGLTSIIGKPALIKELFYHLIEWNDMNEIIELKGGEATPIKQQTYVRGADGELYEMEVTVRIRRAGEEQPPKDNPPKLKE